MSAYSQNPRGTGQNLGQGDPTDYEQVKKREQGQMTSIYTHFQIEEWELQVVELNWFKKCKFTQNSSPSVVAPNLNGSTVVILISNKAAVVANISPFKPDQMGNDSTTSAPHADKIMKRFFKGYDENRKAKAMNLKDKDSYAIVIAELKNGVYQHPDSVNAVIKQLATREFKDETTTIGYELNPSRENVHWPRASVFIDGRDATQPKIYVNKKLVWMNGEEQEDDDTSDQTPFDNGFPNVDPLNVDPSSHGPPGHDSSGDVPPSIDPSSYNQPGHDHRGYTNLNPTVSNVPLNDPSVYGLPAQNPSVYAQPPSAYAQPPSAYAQPPSAYAQPPSAYAQPSSAYAQPSSAYAQDPSAYGFPAQDPSAYGFPAQDPSAYGLPAQNPSTRTSSARTPSLGGSAPRTSNVAGQRRGPAENPVSYINYSIDNPAPQPYPKKRKQ